MGIQSFNYSSLPGTRCSVGQHALQDVVIHSAVEHPTKSMCQHFQVANCIELNPLLLSHQGCNAANFFVQYVAWIIRIRQRFGLKQGIPLWRQLRAQSKPSEVFEASNRIQRLDQGVSEYQMLQPITGRQRAQISNRVMTQV